MSIDLAVGAPISMLRELCPLGRAELCFSHLLLDESSTSYRSYYREARSVGRFFILDNGIMEQGVASTSVDLLKLTTEFRPNLVTPPEVLHDAAETWRLAQIFAAQFDLTNAPECSRILGVAHGASFDEWRCCFERVAGLPWVARIGIPYDIQFDVASSTAAYSNRLQQLVVRRIEICEWVSISHPEIDIHLFGLAHASELRMQARHLFIKSLDTSLPVMAAASGIRYGKTNYGPYQKAVLDINLRHDAATVALARHNIDVVARHWLVD